MATTSPRSEASQLALRLHDLHTALQVGGDATIRVTPKALDDHQVDLLFHGAGLTTEGLSETAKPAGRELEYRVSRPQSLADCVDGEMSVLIVGLNPSLVACDAGFGFAGPSNRFWKAAIAAGLVSRRGEPRHALQHHHVGFTDLVKRPTARASELRQAEFRTGLMRLDALADLLTPRVVCVLGVTGWRAASDNRSATLGLQETLVGGRPVYVMPNPSGLNAHTNHDDLVAHMSTVIELGRPN